MSMGAQTFQTSKSNFNIIGPRRVIGSNFHTKDPQVLGATVQNLVTQIPGELAPGICAPPHHEYVGVLMDITHNSTILQN